MSIIERLLGAAGNADISSLDQRPLATGPLLDDHLAHGARSLDDYRAAGGYELAHRVARDPQAALDEIEAAGVRGRAGGGFPTGLKWRLVARRPEPAKHFVCNANSGPGDRKVPYLLAVAPHRVVEAVCVGALATGASSAWVAVPEALPGAIAAIEAAIAAIEQAGLLGDDAFGAGRPLAVRVVRLPPVYIAGEETAVLAVIEGGAPQPRRKPPLPTAHGVRGAPTVINNLETVLQAALALRLGAAGFRAQGTRHAPGTMVFSLGGDVARPGLCELPLGTPLRRLVDDYGGGVPGGGAIKMVFPGGLSAPPLGAEQLDVALEYDALRDHDADLGSGVVVVVDDPTPAVELAIELARWFHAGSCGQCQPCSDGTRRTALMLERLDQLSHKGVDRAGSLPPTRRRVALRILGNSGAPAGVSYTDNAQGLDKITSLCEFYRHRGDCHHSHEASVVIQTLLRRFRPEFEAKMAAT